MVLPGAAYPEKSATYVNTEGRVQMATRASFPPGDAREDWAILRALSDVLGKKLPYDSLAALRQALYKAHPHMMRLGQIAPGEAADIRSSRHSAATRTRRRSIRASPIFISPIRSRAHPR